jgi:ATP-dependent protease ClpP protease subunit
MNEVLVYGYIYDYSAQEFVRSFSEIEGDSIVCRINTDGGGPEAGWSMIGKFSEFSGQKLVKVDGKAYSMGAFMCCYANDVECFDVSQFLIHRASYGMWYENEYMDDAEKTNLTNVNKKLREAFEAKVDVAKFENLKVCKDNGVTVNRLFSMDERIDVFLTADEAKKIGLVNRIVKITPEKAASINKSVSKLAASSNNIDSLIIKFPENNTPEQPVVVATNENNNKQSIKQTNKMKIEELQAQHPELYAAVVNIGVKQEQDRVGAWMPWQEVDADAVKAGISSGASISQKDISEFALKHTKSVLKVTLETEGKETEIDETDKTVETDKPVDKVAELTAAILAAK